MKKISGIIFLTFVMSFSLYAYLSIQSQGVAQGSDPLSLEVGDLKDYPVGTVKPFPEDKFIIFRDESGLYAISTECTHNGCNLNFRAKFKTFMCPCHGSTFNKKGEVMSGPAKKALPWYSVEVDADGKVRVDKSKTIAPGTKFNKFPAETSDCKK